MPSSADMRGDANDGLQYTDLTDLDGASMVTLAGWFYFDSNQDAYLVTKDETFTNTSYEMFIDNSQRLQIIVKNGASWDGQWTDSGIFTTINSGEWVFLAVTWDYNAGARVMNIYANGVSVANGARQSDQISSLENTTGLFKIGFDDTSSFPLNGKAAYIHVYDRDLSLPEIQEIQVKPGSVGANLIYFLPLTDAAYTDIQGNAGTAAVTTGVTASLLGPPVYFPQLGT